MTIKKAEMMMVYTQYNMNRRYFSLIKYFGIKTSVAVYVVPIVTGIRNREKEKT